MCHVSRHGVPAHGQGECGSPDEGVYPEWEGKSYPTEGKGDPLGLGSYLCLTSSLTPLPSLASPPLPPITAACYPLSCAPPPSTLQNDALGIVLANWPLFLLAASLGLIVNLISLYIIKTSGSTALKVRSYAAGTGSLMSHFPPKCEHVCAPLACRF